MLRLQCLILIAIIATSCTANTVPSILQAADFEANLSAAGTEVKCSAANEKHAATSCNQYFICSRVWWWLEPKLQTCPIGEAFSQEVDKCVASSNCKPAVPDKCTEAGKYPGYALNEYYECKFAWFKWRLYKVICPEDEDMIFDYSTQDCIPLPL